MQQRRIHAIARPPIISQDSLHRRRKPAAASVAAISNAPSAALAAPLAVAAVGAGASLHCCLAGPTPGLTLPMGWLLPCSGVPVCCWTQSRTDP